MSSTPIAVVGMACRYPDADDHQQLWDNVLTGRRAFRNIPKVRLNPEDYFDPDPATPDQHYTRKAAVIEGFEFDRVKYRIAGSTFRATDMTHWLALDTAARALADAGFPGGVGLPGMQTGVFIGNSLTGEFTRASVMRLRWPYVRRTVAAALAEQADWTPARLASFLDALEEQYKAPFPPIDEDSLAGGLANTIAGRICNFFDFGGGGYVVDGACSSSLLSIATACNALADGQLGAALAGGVDLSIDPFEVVGFAKTGALARREMRVYDKRSNGFWPGEGCGVLVLMRDSDARAQGLRRYAVIRGWGISSDGKGGITRPEAAGHQRAIDAAYQKAGFSFGSIEYLEGHGTGTPLGDATELSVFVAARRREGGGSGPLPLGTIKGNIGHTKAAAGVAGVLKAVLAVHHQVIPPATGTVEQSDGVDAEMLRLPVSAEPWPVDRPRRAGVSSMGFGGINAHLVIEGVDEARPAELDARTVQLSRSRQDAELLLLDAVSTDALAERARELAAFAAGLSYAELGDLAATLADNLDGRPVRAAVVAGSPDEAAERLTILADLALSGVREVVRVKQSIFLGVGHSRPRIGYLFPGQGAGSRSDGGALRRRFDRVDALYREHPVPAGADLVATEIAQPRIVTASLAGLRVLADLGITAMGCAGHSLGELTALHWAGALAEDQLLDIARVRGRIMSTASDGGGAMASLRTSVRQAQSLIEGLPLVVAGLNAPRQTVLSGSAEAIENVLGRAREAGIDAVRIRVSHAFHSPAVAAAARGLRDHLDEQSFGPVSTGLYSSVTGGELERAVPVADLLERQVMQPVLFSPAVAALAGSVDLLVEVGPGTILSDLATEISPVTPAVSMEADSDSVAGTLRVAGALFAAGAPVRTERLFADRYRRPLQIGKELRFFANPCESAPAALPLPAGTGPATSLVTSLVASTAPAAPAIPASVGSPAAAGTVAVPAAPTGAQPGGSTLDTLRRIAAQRAEIPIEHISAETAPLDELHFSSITVGQIVSEAARERGLPVPEVATSYATATLGDIADLLDELPSGAPQHRSHRPVLDGLDPWVHAFVTDLHTIEIAPLEAVHPPSRWQLFGAGEEHLLLVGLAHRLERAGLGDGVLLYAPQGGAGRSSAPMLDAARQAIADGRRFVAVGGAAALARTLHLEHPQIPTTVLLFEDGPEQGSPSARLLDTAAACVGLTTGFGEFHLAADAAVRVPELTLYPERPEPLESYLGNADVLLVTGGGKGITSECALQLAAESGAKLVILGRSDPAEDSELAANLARIQGRQVAYRYHRVDVTSAEQVHQAVAAVVADWGPITAVLHGAGVNEPRPLTMLGAAEFDRTVEVKLAGLEHVLAALDPDALRLLVTFGSIIGRAGLAGEAHYATANDWMAERTRAFGQAHPNVRCRCIEWSVWSGTGMGERLGVLDSLIRSGIEPIPTEAGLAVCRRLVDDPDAPTVPVVMGRVSGLPTLAFAEAELPLLRFVDRPVQQVAGVELVVETDLSAGTDLYLADHDLDGELLFPAVMGMEAMAQAGAALTGASTVPGFEDVRFNRPIVVPVHGQTTIRIAAQTVAPGRVRVSIRSSDTGFQAEHFAAILVQPRPEIEGDQMPPVSEDTPPLALDPQRDLYGRIMFQGRRFQRVAGYRYSAATSCVADIDVDDTVAWFAPYLPSRLLLGDPGARDAFMHAIQVCVPTGTLLPSGIDKLYPAPAEAINSSERLTLYALERHRSGNTYVYDLDVRVPSGKVIAHWSGLTLHAVRVTDGSGPWHPALLGPHLERRLDQAGGGHRVVLVDDASADTWPPARRSGTATALGVALGLQAVLSYRPDGKPETAGEEQVSAAHGAGVTLLVAGESTVGCDLEAVAERDEATWQDLLGAAGFRLAERIRFEHGESLDVAGTRVWGAIEAVRKSGQTIVPALSLTEECTDPG
ncbi:MAG: enediyne polyketide synthase, partial [Pseudonocardiales bacterium]|nr:enediyne polyketide synthase [Pseudonocardiales bacterium]